MTESILPVKIHPECFKIRDNRISLLLNSKITAEYFSLLITEDDPFILIGDTIYALTEVEYYATRKKLDLDNVISDTFNAIMHLDTLENMDKEDIAFIEGVKKELPTCPSCKYKRYKNEIYKIAKKYKLDNQIEIKSQYKPYPECDAPVQSYVTYLIPDLYKSKIPQRKFCLDCAEKHIAQAYILANEAMMGYPEHLTLMCGHLGEAIDELPLDDDGLADTLKFCIAKSTAMNKPFLPLYAILPHLINLISTYKDNNSPVIKQEKIEAPVSLDLDFTDEMKIELQYIPDTTINRLKKLFNTVIVSILEYKKDNTNPYKCRIPYEGSLNCAADAVVQFAPKFANMLRNRRLMFKYDIGTAADAGYDFKDIIEYLETRMKN